MPNSGTKFRGVLLDTLHKGVGTLEADIHSPGEGWISLVGQILFCQNLIDCQELDTCSDRREVGEEGSHLNMSGDKHV